MSLKKLNYDKLMLQNPTEYGRTINQFNQEVIFYEHPVYGDDHSVIAVIHEYKIACITDFYDLDDFYPDSEYLPFYQNDEMIYFYEI